MTTNEPKLGVNTGNRGKGRPKGSKNKLTAIAKDVIAQVADNLGGAERLTSWAQENADNEKAFWVSIYPKLLPLQVTGEEGGPIKIQKVENVIIDPAHTGS